MRRSLSSLIFISAAFFAAALCPTLVISEPAVDPVQSFDRPERADGARVTPDKILRGYDPITVFFTSDIGPSTNKPEDNAEKYVSITPKAQGEWRWLGPRALQFRPAEAWSPLSRVNVKLGSIDTQLLVLLPTPSATVPDSSADPTPEITQVSLTFSQPVDIATLSKLISVEIRPSPGISTQETQTLNPSSYDILAAERHSRQEPQTYILRFHEKISDGRVVIVKLKLADAPGYTDEIYELRALTAPPFSVSEYSCGDGWQDEEIDDFLRCSSYNTSYDQTKYEPTAKRRLSLRFTSKPQPIDIVLAREAFRITPPVDDLNVEVKDQDIKLSGRFLSDQIYKLDINEGKLQDKLGRPLARAFSKKFAFSKNIPSLHWDAGYGIVERYGPQYLPLRGRGYDHADIRIYAIDPLARDFWPFPEHGIETNDEDPPPLPGAEPKNWKEISPIEEEEIKARIKALGSPPISKIVELPIRRDGSDTRFGLDLSSDFASISGKEQPGTYLVGLRTIDDKKRRWLHVQVTDLSISAIEEPSRVGFIITSLSDETPIKGAQIKIEGIKDDKIVNLGSGVTDSTGFYAWTPPHKEPGELVRIIVTKGLDTLVIDPDSAPAQYANELWSKPEEPWLSWTGEEEPGRKEKPRTLCHVFSERPIYRPEDFAHIKGFVRTYQDGALLLPKQGGDLVINGPGQQEWRIPIKLDEKGNFYHKFDAQTPATGEYSVRFETSDKNAFVKSDSSSDNTDSTSQASPENKVSCGQFSFKKEAYRLPTFEVVLNAPETVSLDSNFNVDLLARYFSGGLAADRPVKWRAAQFPYVYKPPHKEGFFFSSDSRFSGEAKFKSNAVLERDQKTDAGGSARLTFDTTVEATSQPRRYSIEATVTGDDGIEVRNVQNIIALPPFVLGVKMPRYIERPGSIIPEVIAINGKGDPVEGQEMTLRLIRRNWISTLQASDFSQGSAKYITQTQDEVLLERMVTSAREAQQIQLETKEAGVYLIQIEAYDKLKRRQQVSIDFFVGGDTPVTFSRPPAQSAIITSDKDKYIAGETATLIIQSPFQNAHALAVVEQPNGIYDYHFVEIKNGFGRYPLAIKKEQMPKLAVHFLIMRGRLKNTELTASSSFDQGKPVTIAATKWIDITPAKNSINVKIDAPNKARPGQEVEVGIQLTDDTGKAISGDVTFWMVDQAVLSLAKEQALEPLPDFIVLRETKMSARDTRNMAFGVIPLEEISGGDGGDLEEWGAETNISVRKNFTPVPIYIPNLKVDADGRAKIKVKLPDSLTVFKLRAKATSGSDRFGATGSEMLIRQDIIAQPVLPRFLRPGDSFDLGVVARVVEGAASSGSVNFATNDFKIIGETKQNVSWEKNKAARIDVIGEIPKELQNNLKIDFKVERDSDHVRDAVQVELPIKPDRDLSENYEIVEIGPGETKSILPALEDARKGTFKRQIVVASDPSIVKLIAGLNYLVAYPYGCTEQRLALARAGLALKSFSPILTSAGLSNRISDIVSSATSSIERSVDGNGLVAYWPRSEGDVSLTAWSYMFLNQALRNGETVDKSLIERLRKILESSLRSDYSHLIGGQEMRQRVTALAALADGGTIDQAYVAEFLRNTNFLPSESLAEMVLAITRVSDADPRIAQSLMDSIWSRIKFVTRNGQQVYLGQAGAYESEKILTSEIRSLAEISRASARAAPGDARTNIIRDALIRLGDGDGWGNTNANASAIEALAETWRKQTLETAIIFKQGDVTLDKKLDVNTPAINYDTHDNSPVSITNSSNTKIVALIQTSYVPIEAGAQAKSQSNGFAIMRQSWRISGANPAEKIDPNEGVIHLKSGDVVEEIVEVVNPENRSHVAITIPLPAGYEPLNPNLSTSPAEAKPSFAPTAEPSWVSFKDDHVFYAYDDLPKGNYRFAFRLRAQTNGSFTQPPAFVETMYKKGLRGATNGFRVEIAK